MPTLRATGVILTVLLCFLFIFVVWLIPYQLLVWLAGGTTGNIGRIYLAWPLVFIAVFSTWHDAIIDRRQKLSPDDEEWLWWAPSWPSLAIIIGYTAPIICHLASLVFGRLQLPRLAAWLEASRWWSWLGVGGLALLILITGTILDRVKIAPGYQGNDESDDNDRFDGEQEAA